MSFRNSILALTLAVAGACFTGSVTHAAVSQGVRCSAFIHIFTRPGVEVNVPYGAVYHNLREARHDAIKRCRLTDEAKEGYGRQCRAHCLPKKTTEQ